MKIVHSLNGTWQMTFTDPGVGDHKRLFVEPLAVEPWFDTPVPGDVHTTLHQANLIPDPYVADNLEECRWTQEKDFWFRRPVTLPPEMLEHEHIELVFHGVDTIAEVWWNDQFLGRMEDMFLAYRFEISQLLHGAGPHHLTVKIYSLEQARKPYYGQRAYRAIKDLTRVFLRKPQCQFGWDWSPEFGSIGIWRNVELEAWSETRIDNVQVVPYANGTVKIFLALTRRLKGTVGFTVEGHGESLNHSREVDGTHTFAALKLENPKLWWPNGLGEQPLYTAHVHIRNGDSVLDTACIRFGVREVTEHEDRLSNDALNWGIEVNGKRVFCKGANWVPPDIFPGACPPERIRGLLSRAWDAGFNMLRIWGGGAYPSDLFFDLCDQMGILVWQDFMFANADYPLDREAFRRTVIAEVAYQVKRLRNHPSLAVWCGGNEKSSSFAIEHSAESDFDLFGVQIPGQLNLLDRSRPYVISSPIAYTDIGNDRSSGNSHTSVWLWAYFDNVNVVPFRSWLNPPPAFKSEFFIMGSARARSLRKMFGKGNIWPPDEVWPYRFRGAPEWNRGRMTSFHEYQINTVTKFYRRPENLSEFIKFSSVLQMEQAREEFEHGRCFRERCGGSIFWMMNDTWPTSTWALVDFYGNPKPVYYGLKCASAPVICTVTDRGEDYAVFVCNDTPQPVRGKVRVRYRSTSGKEHWSKELDFETSRLSSIPVLPVAKKDVELPDSYIHVAMQTETGVEWERFYYPALWRDLPLEDPAPELKLVEKSRKDAHWHGKIEISVKRFARALFVDVEPLNECVWNDNFFDLEPGNAKILKVRSPRDFTEADFQIGHWLTDWSQT